MRAAVVTDFHSPLQVQDLPIPEPGAGEVLVRIETSGLCHTDIHAAHGDWPVKPTPPFIPGHEGVGYVEKLGMGVTTRAVGNRVAIAWLGYACGECRYCNSGWETLCNKQQNSGYSVNGTFAEYAVVPAAFAAPVPDGISSRDAAPLTCAGVTTYKAIKVARVAPAETVAIFGVGGLGHLALQYARIACGFVIAVDIEDHKLTMATELGADHVVNALTTDPVEAIQALGGADVAVALAASPAAFDQAYRSLRRGGRLVCVALPADNATRACRSSTPSSTARLSSARSSAPVTTSPTSSPCTPPAAPRSSPSTARSTRLTNPSTTSSPAPSRPVSSSGSNRLSSEPPATALFPAAESTTSSTPWRLPRSSRLPDNLSARTRHSRDESRPRRLGGRLS